MSRSESPSRSTAHRVLLLAGQAFALGLMMAWILIAATAIFIARYGSGMLPVTYICAAVAGALASAALARALRRRSLAAVASLLLWGLAAILIASWFVLWQWGGDWVSFLLLVLVPIIVPVGFMLVLGQAGMLLDVRAMKALYARVISGFAMGFVAGGLVGPLLISALGGTEDLLGAAAAVAAVFAVLVGVTRRSFPAELSVIETGVGERLRLRTLLRERYVVLIVAFQMLSAIESQWLDYLVFDRAAQRYDDSQELATFVGRFTAIAYGADIIFLVVVAGLLLRRFGLRYGLVANSAGVLAMLTATIVATSMFGSAATVVFVLVVAARVCDLVLADGAARASLGTAYQAVPNRIRSMVQATVEGLAVPLAIGLSGVVLLLLRSTAGTDGLVLPVLTTVVVIVWAVVAILLYRRYGTDLLAGLRHRLLDDGIDALATDDLGGPVVIDRLLDSADEADVRLGLEMLARSGHGDATDRIARLAIDERPDVRIEALELLLGLDPSAAGVAARAAVDHPDARVRAACIRTLAVVGDHDFGDMGSALSDPSPDVRVAVAFATSHVGDDDSRRRVADEITALLVSTSTDSRILAARMIGACDTVPGLDRSELGTLLLDPEHDVANAALAATRWPDDDACTTLVVAHLGDRRTALAAASALVRGGDLVLPAIDDALRANELASRAQENLARVCRTIAGPTAIAVLERHIDHPEREIGLAIMNALAVDRWSRRSDNEGAEVGPGIDGRCSDVIRVDLELATAALHAIVVLDDVPSAELLRSALEDEIDLVRRRVLAALSVRHGTAGMGKVAYQFAQRDHRAHTLALEWLDVTLTGPDKAVVGLLEPGLSDRGQLRALQRWFPTTTAGVNEVLRDLIEDPDQRWRRSWITACAVYASSAMSPGHHDVLDSLDQSHPSIVTETITGLRQRRQASAAVSAS